MPNDITLDLVLGFGEATIGTQDELFNVAVDQILEDTIRVSAIDNGAIGVCIVPGLRSQFGAKELVDFRRTAVQAQTHVGDVRNGGLRRVGGWMKKKNWNSKQLGCG
jgi:hypothetical protein